MKKIQTRNLLRLTALAALMSLNACNKIEPNSERVNQEPSMASDASARLGYTNYNRNLTFYALSTDNKIDKYSTVIPKRLLNSASITGLQPSETLLAIDFRPATGQLYGLGSSSRLYVINPATGTARALGTGPFTPMLSGQTASLDFNPTVDRVRIITNTGQNLRLNPETGAVVAIDGNINGLPEAAIAGAAYTNNSAGVTSTALFDIDKVTNNLLFQNPPNNGTVSIVGPLGLDVQDGEFDIAGTGDAFGLYSINNVTNLISINLATGQANIINDYPVNYKGIAIATQPVAYAMDGTNKLMIFNPEIYYSDANLGTIISKQVTGLASGESIVGIDFRPINGQLYALGISNNVYTINLASGAAAISGTLSAALNGSSFGFDFNPVVDRIRIVSNTGQNLRFNPNDGTTIIDGNFNPGMPFISSAAYSNNFAGTTTTTLFGIDSATSQLVKVIPPNAGTIVPVGSLGITVSSANGFDIGGTSGTAYALFRAENNRTRIYTINLTTGQASGAGIIGSTEIKGLAIAPGF